MNDFKALWQEVEAENKSLREGKIMRESFCDMHAGKLTDLVGPCGTAPNQWFSLEFDAGGFKASVAISAEDASTLFTWLEKEFGKVSK
jgi:hypothetical protein